MNSGKEPSKQIHEKRFLQKLKKKFEYYKMLGVKTFSHLQDDQLFWQ